MAVLGPEPLIGQDVFQTYRRASSFQVYLIAILDQLLEVRNMVHLQRPGHLGQLDGLRQLDRLHFTEHTSVQSPKILRESLAMVTERKLLVLVQRHFFIKNGGLGEEVHLYVVDLSPFLGFLVLVKGVDRSVSIVIICVNLCSFPRDMGHQVPPLAFLDVGSERIPQSKGLLFI